MTTNEAILHVTPQQTAIVLGRQPRPAWRLVEVAVGLAFAVALFGCGDSDGGSHSTPPSSLPMLAVLSAFPGEMAPVLARATIERTEMVGNRVFRIGTINGVPVVIGMTGIGLVNAATTTRAMLERFPVEGIVVSAVAGSPYRIGDVVVPEEWFETDGPTYATDQEWLAIAEEITVPGAIDFESCTSVPDQSPDPVCLTKPPVLVVGGVGHSSDPFGGTAAPCFPNGHDVFGCDLKDDTGSAMIVFHEANHAGGLDADVPVAEDMETAAIAAEADAHDIPFIAFRAVSDGDGDPLGLPGFPTQFFAYYHMAANNAAAATAAFLERIAAAHR